MKRHAELFIRLSPGRIRSRSGRSQLNVVLGGAEALLEWLELQLGLPAPLNPATLDARTGQFLRVGRTGPVNVYAFTDESNTLGIERLQRKAIEIKKAFGSDEVQKLLFDDETRASN